MTTTKVTCKETAIVAPLFAHLCELQQTNSAYFKRFEDANVDIAPRSVLLNLIVAAPNDQVKFFLLGKLTMRVGQGR